jgi:tripartite-type tricarboxylate transporter receptor subunit TctC
MGEQLGQQFVIENKPGAGTNIGADTAARAEPDGYTLLLGDTATFATNRTLYRKLSFDPYKDFTPISLTGRFALVLLVNTNKLPVKSVQELVAEAKKNPGRINYATPGLERVDIQDSRGLANLIQAPFWRGGLGERSSSDVERSPVGSDGAAFAGQTHGSRPNGG